MVTPTNNGWIPNTSPPFVNIANWGFNVFNIMFWQYVMVQLKGSVTISFGGTQELAAYGELVSIGGLGSDTNKKLSAAIAATLERKVNVPKSRFYIKFYDVKVGSQFLSLFCLCENGFPIEPSSAPVVLIF